MNPTKLLCLNDLTLLVSNGKVIDTISYNDKTILILDQTNFYPQGGGQLYDTGIISSSSCQFQVEEVRLHNEVVNHIGKYVHGNFQIGDIVKCTVDAEKRHLHNRLHSAGHVIDMSVKALQLGWLPHKACHFPGNSCVEYIGSFNGFESDELKVNLENTCNTFIQQGLTTSIAFVDFQQLKSLCDFIPSYLTADKPIRIIKFADFAVPCGGTHVININEIKHITIRKIKLEKGKLKVSYAL